MNRLLRMGTGLTEPVPKGVAQVSSVPADGLLAPRRHRPERRCKLGPLHAHRPAAVGLIVQKYGGTSVGSVERIRNVAKRIAKWKAAGHDLIVVPSAMAGETNRLIALAHEVQAHPEPRELDVIASTGEQVTVGLLAMALLELGVPSRSHTGWQVKVLTDEAFTRARIV